MPPQLLALVGCSATLGRWSDRLTAGLSLEHLTAKCANRRCAEENDRHPLHYDRPHGIVAIVQLIGNTAIRVPGPEEDQADPRERRSWESVC